MIKITLICVGSLKEKYFKEALAEYKKRLSAFCKLNIIEIDEQTAGGDIQKNLITEAEKITKKINTNAFVIPLCIEGAAVTSNELADLIQAQTVSGKSEICFIIGGSNGLDTAVKAQGDTLLSMSKMTFPHHLARIMIVEQIYRAFMIIRGTKYHK